jgi:aldehyde dehydrogenase (NAD+)
MIVAENLDTLTYGVAPESSKPAFDWLAEHNHRFGLFINKEWRDPSSKEWFASINPATKKKLVDIAHC